MARFYGAVGFAESTEVRPGIYKEYYMERSYKGDVIKSNRRWTSSEYLNDKFEITNDISIIADTFANHHVGVMRYVRWMNQAFEITSAMVDVERHRIILSLGGVFNVPETAFDEETERISPVFA